MASPDNYRAVEIARASSASMHAADIAAQNLGMSVADIGPGHASVVMTVTDDMLDDSGCCHPGLIFSLADTAFAHACNSYNIVALASACSVEYVNQARAGDELIAVAKEKHRSRRTGVYDVDILNKQGLIIAVFRGKSLATGDRLVDGMEQQNG